MEILIRRRGYVYDSQKCHFFSGFLLFYHFSRVVPPLAKQFQVSFNKIKLQVLKDYFSLPIHLKRGSAEIFKNNATGCRPMNEENGFSCRVYEIPIRRTVGRGVPEIELGKAGPELQKSNWARQVPNPIQEPSVKISAQYWSGGPYVCPNKNNRIL